MTCSLITTSDFLLYLPATPKKYQAIAHTTQKSCGYQPSMSPKKSKPSSSVPPPPPYEPVASSSTNYNQIPYPTSSHTTFELSPYLEPYPTTSPAFAPPTTITSTSGLSSSPAFVNLPVPAAKPKKKRSCNTAPLFIVLITLFGVLWLTTWDSNFGYPFWAWYVFLGCFVALCAVALYLGKGKEGRGFVVVWEW